MTLKLNIIVGLTRPGRVGPTIAQWLAEFASAHSKFEVALVEPSGETSNSILEELRRWEVVLLSRISAHETDRGVL